MELIDKDKVTAELERLKSAFVNERDDFEKGYHHGLDMVLYFLDTIETKEVDLEKEVELWMQGKPSVKFEWGNVADAMRDCAKYFFELGMQVSNKTQKGEEV